MTTLIYNSSKYIVHNSFDLLLPHLRASIYRDNNFAPRYAKINRHRAIHCVN